MMRLFGSLKEPLKTTFLTDRYSEFIPLIFPIDIPDYPRFSLSLLLRFFSLFRHILSLNELLEIPAVRDSIRRFVRTMDDDSARRFGKYLSARPTDDSQISLLGFLVHELNAPNSGGTGAILISTVVSLVSSHVDDETFTFLVEWLLQQLEDGFMDTRFIARLSGACAELVKLSGTKSLTRVDPFEAKVPAVVSFIAVPGANQHTQYTVREGLRVFLHTFGAKYPALNVAILDAVADFVLGEDAIANPAFWSLQHLFCACVVLVPDKETRQAFVDREFGCMFDFLERAATGDFEKCFAYMVQLIREDGYRSHDAWASLMYCMLIGTTLFWDGVKEFLVQVIASETDESAMERFGEFVGRMSVKNPTELDEAIERAALCLQAKPALAAEMLRRWPIDQAVQRNWPRNHANLKQLFQLPAVP
jgi:hypothetical protein